MHKKFQSRVKWLAGWTVGLSLLGGCGVAEEAGPADGAGAREVAADDVKVSLSVAKSTLAAAEGVEVTVTLTNVSRRPVQLLKWYTPDAELEEALFTVTRNGEPVEYLGAHYKRPAPRAEDFLTLAPGERLTRTVELSGFYDLSETGNYSVAFQVDALRLQGVAAGPGRVLESNAVALWVEGRPSPMREDAGGVTAQVTSAVSFSKCSVDQEPIVLDALNAASGMADDSVTYLNGSPSATPRYTTWFGAFSTSGWNTAKSHFVAIKDVFDNKPMTFDCGCKKKYYAYVYPNQPYVIYLCSVFWDAPMTGTDSKGGTIIHETSHFDVVAGTDDWAYGQTNARSLASSDPTKALNNADNHEYFAENTPALQ